MIEIKAGPELDRAVAEAIGWTYRLADGRDGEILGLTCWHTPEGQQHHGYPPQFSTDLNAAFAAAEKVGLFDRDRGHAFIYKGQYRNVDIRWIATDAFQDEPLGSGETPALAICAAILKMNGCDFTAGRMDAMGGLSVK